MADKTNHKNQQLLVIGAGLPRTGTTSLHTALEQILGPTYHMRAMFNSKGSEDAKFWIKAQKRQASDDDWKKFVNDRKLVAGVDFPMSFYWKDLMQIYPDAKVILSVRSPQSWYKSVKETLEPMFDFQYSLTASLGSALIRGQLDKREACFGVSLAYPANIPHLSMMEAVRHGEGSAVNFYEKWVQEVKENVPPEKLLIFEAKEGWEPLCKFLDLPVPNNPYPRVNDAAEFQKMTRNIKIMLHFIVYILPLFLALIIGLVAKYFQLI